MDANFAPGSFIFQQDGTPAHTATMMQELLAQMGWRFWTKDQWLLSSQDLNPFDYGVWDTVARIVQRTISIPCANVWRKPGWRWSRRKCAISAEAFDGRESKRERERESEGESEGERERERERELQQRERERARGRERERESE